MCLTAGYTNECDVAYDVSAESLLFTKIPSQYGTVKAFSLSGTTFTATQSALRINSTESMGNQFANMIQTQQCRC